jgi:hypothetical protein
MLLNNMQSERINLYKLRQGSTKVYIAVGIVFLVLGLVLLFTYLSLDTEFSGHNWNSVLYALQGIVFILIGFYYLKYRKYFIEWNDSEITYRLKGDKHTKRIEISDIKALEIKINKVIIHSDEHTKAVELNFEQIEYKTLRKIKDRFETIKERINKKEE